MSERTVDVMTDGLPEDPAFHAGQQPASIASGATRSHTTRVSLHTIVADRTEELTMGTRIATSFTRSPMVLAQMV